MIPNSFTFIIIRKTGVNSDLYPFSIYKKLKGNKPHIKMITINNQLSYIFFITRNYNYSSNKPWISKSSLFYIRLSFNHKFSIFNYFLGSIPFYLLNISCKIWNFIWIFKQWFFISWKILKLNNILYLPIVILFIEFKESFVLTFYDSFPLYLLLFSYN